MTSSPALRSRTVLLALVTVLTFALVLVAPVPARAAFLNYDVGSEQEFRNALAFFYRLQDEPGLWTEGEVFSDVPEDHPFFTEITFMYEWNYSTGYEDGTYRPSNTISRQAMAAFLERADD